MVAEASGDKLVAPRKVKAEASEAEVDKKNQGGGAQITEG